jgi:hypothetical protein
MGPLLILSMVGYEHAMQHMGPLLILSKENLPVHAVLLVRSKWIGATPAARF